MSWYLVVKLLHIGAVIACVGGIFARQVVRGLAKRSGDIHTFASMSRAAGRIEAVLVIPGTSAILVFGVMLALMGGGPMLGFLQGASRNWLLVSNLLLLAMLILIPTVLVPRGRAFEPILQDALQRSEFTPELHAAMDDGAVRFAHLYEELALIVITALMVLKPF